MDIPRIQLVLSTTQGAASTHVAVHDLVVLGSLDDRFNLLDGTVHVGADAADDNDVLSSRVASLCA